MLLSGGDPQIPKGDGDAPVKAYIAAMPEWKHNVGEYINEMVCRTVPNVQLAVKWNSPFYGVEGDRWFLSFHCLTQYVKVAFFQRDVSSTPPSRRIQNSKHSVLEHLREPANRSRIVHRLDSPSFRVGLAVGPFQNVPSQRVRLAK